MRTTIPLFICALFLRLCAQTTLSGNIGGVTLEQAGNPYIVTETITVQDGKTTTIKPGCTFLFKPYTGIDVHGELTVTGVHDTPVVFTSINDINYNKASEQAPAPFDWNGMTIGSDAKNVHLANFMLAYSVYGIKAVQKNVAIKNGIFLQNGQFHFTVNNAIQQVPENLPYSYNPDQSKKNAAIVKPARPAVMAAIATGGAGVICGAVSGAFWNDYRKAWHDAEYAKNSIEISDANKREENGLKNAGILTGVSVTLFSTAALLYIVDYRQHKDKQASFAPLPGPEYTGIIFNCTF